MSKITAFLATVGLMLFSLAINAQPTFYFSPSDPMPPLGGQITVDIVVDDFTDITSYQYSVNWNASHFSYVSISNFNGDLSLGAGNFGTTMTNSGKLSTLWSDPMANPQSIPNGSVLFTLTLDVIASSAVSSNIQFTGNPTAKEVTQDTGGGIMDITSSTTFTNTVIDIDGGGGGGGPTCTFGGFGLLVDSDSAATGDQFCLNVYTCNFTDIVSMQYTMQFNPNLLQFDNVGAFNLQNLNGGAFGATNAGQGFITVSWFDSLGAGVTLPNETPIYEICFTAIGAGGEMDSVLINGNLAPIEVTDVASGGANIGLESIDGEVLITGTSGSAVTVFAECESGNPGDTIYVDVSVRNYTEMLGLQYSMGWNPAVVEFHETVWTGALPGSPTFNTSPALVDNGKLTFLWSDPLVTGVTVPDSTVIYQVGYIIVGNVAEMTAINFTGDPTAIEATQDDMGSPQVVPLARIPGKVEVLGDGVFNLILNDVTACTGDTINVPVTADGFNEIISMQYDVRWSPGELEYLGLNGFNLSGLNNGSFNALNDSTLRCAWVEPVLNPQTKPDGETLYNMRFVVLGADASTADLLVLDSPPMHLFEISDNDGVIFPYQHTDGLITVDCSMVDPIDVTDTLITNVLCFGATTGAIDITVTGGTGSFTYLWSNGETTEDLTGLAAGTYTVTISSGGLDEIQTYTVTEPLELTATTSATDATCNGDNDGTASVTPSGGTSAYTYVWSNAGEATMAISGLTAGTYTVTVTDANMCTVVETATVGEPDALGLTTSSTPASCNGDSDGSATVTPSGGTPGYTYVWGSGLPDVTPTVTGLSAGNYAVTVTDANMCTAVTIIVVGEPDVLTASATGTDVTCNGDTDGATTLTINGGTTAYIYDWDHDGTGDTDDPQNLNNVAPDTYNVTVTDANGCTATASATVGEPALVSATAVITHESAVDADDGAINITTAGGTGSFTYLWSNAEITEDITGLAPGTYTVTITDTNGCTGVQSFEVFEFAAPILVVDNTTDVSCNGGSDGSISITVSDGTPGYTYNWDLPSTNEDLTGLPAGTYNLTVTDNAGVTVTTSVTIMEPDAITIIEDNITEVTCSGSSDGAIEVSVNGGTPAFTYDWGGGLTTEDLSGIPGGTYTLTVTDDNGCTAEGNPIIIAEPAPIVITVVSATNPQCNGAATGCIDIEVTGGTPNYSYAWSTGANFTQDLCGLLAGTYTVTVTDSRGCVMVSDPIMLTEPAAINVSSFVGMVSCNGLSDGSIDLTVTGGSGSYTSYAWNPSLPNQEDQTNLPAGSYSVTITDSDGCTQVAGPIGVTEPAALSLTNDVTNASASNDDGAINITVTGGTPSYTYLWNNGATTMDLNGIASGCYVITVTDGNGCVVEDSIKVGGVIVVTGVVTDVSCNGDDDGAIDITVTGGIQPYTYNWQDPLPDVQDQFGLTAGTYCVTVEDSNGSLAVECFTVDQPQALTILNSTVTNETGDGCNGGIAIEVIGGTPPYAYNWNNGATNEDLTNLCKGSYQVTIVDDNGCILISNMFTVAPPPLVVDDSGMNNVSCFGGSDGGGCLEVSGGCGPYKFTLIATGQVINSTSGEACFQNLAAGSYLVSVMDSGSPIMVISHTFTIGQPTEIAVVDTIIVNNTDPTGNNCNGAINITVAGGTPPYTYQWSNNMTSEDIANVCELGNPYSVTITDGNGCIHILAGLEIELGMSIIVDDVDNVTCIDDCDGTIDITVNGGEAPYTYNWSHGAVIADPSGLCPGNYSVTVTDANGLTITKQGITIAQPAAALALNVVSIGQPTGAASNGAIDIMPAGGWGGYSYMWSNGAQSQDVGGLVEGTYTVTLTDGNGCQLIRIIEVEALRLSLTFEIEEPSCNGRNDGFVEVFVEGGSGDYSYNWSTGHNTPLAFDLTAGSVTVTVSDQVIPGLSATETIVLDQPGKLIVTVECGDNSGMLEARVQGGTAPYSYLWNTPASDTLPIVANLTPGTYGVRVEDANNCVSIAQGETCNESECFDAREIISVNNDGLNDVFIISCVESYNNTLRVFNRWGQMVFEATNYDNSWMGTDLDGNELPEDGYFYVLEYEEAGQTIQIKGAITVLR